MPKRKKEATSKFRIFETDEFRKSFQKRNPTEREFIRKKLKEYVYPRLIEEPFVGQNIRKLSGYSPDTWRYRIGRYRFFYIVDQSQKTVFVLTFDDRKDIYRR